MFLLWRRAMVVSGGLYLSWERVMRSRGQRTLFGFNGDVVSGGEWL
jgi:hypothetical protein